jgi:pimeloyl-ACP methyl ester carboxylesterase
MQTTSATTTRTNDLLQTPPTFIDVSAAKLAYWKIGQGPDLVFFHGWPLSALTYRRLAPLLAERFTCHLFDLPGAGQTIDKGEVNIEMIMRASRELIERLGLTRYALVAHDSGALFARLLAANNPQVAALVSGNTELPGYHSQLINRLVWVAKTPGGVALVQQLMKLRAVRCSKFGFQGAFASDDFIEGEFYRSVLAPMLASRSQFERVFSLLRRFDFSLVDQLEATHARIAAPVRFIWGADDRIFPLKRAEKMISQFPGGATMHTIKGGRCFAHEEFADEFAALAQPFLEEHLASRQEVD